MRRRALIPVFAVPALLCAAWTVFAGKDVNWDQLNYHYYLPYELLHGRVQQDFFAASAQSYLNPVGYLPFYLMVASGWHSVAASIALAALHSASIALLYLIAWRLFGHLTVRERAFFSALAAAAGAATGIFWATVGGSFLDPLLAPLMLAGLLALLGPAGRPLLRGGIAGALFGAAAALKYSNAIFALAALPLALALPGLRPAARLHVGMAYAAGGVAALAVLAGPWFALMTREFGNPLFPLMNAWFESPDVPAVNLVNARFTPQDAGAAAALPFRMLLLDPALYAETFAPDLRLAALLAAVAALPVVGARRSGASRALRADDWRVLAFLASAAGLWVASSANARYGMVVLLLAGVALARVTERLLAPAAARVAVLLLLAVQVGMIAAASPARWFIAAPWSQRWFPYEVPQRALKEPALYLTLEFLPMAVVAPLVHPDASFVNFRGQHSLPSDSPRLRALLDRHEGRVRVLGRALELSDGRPRVDQVRAYDATLLRIGYRVDPEDCFTIAWRPDSEDGLSRAANRLAGALPPHEPLSVVSCGARRAPRDPLDAERERLASALFDRIEQSCAALFRGQTAVTEPLGSGWSRFYSGLDLRLESRGDRVALRHRRLPELLDLGTVAEWRAGGAGRECPRIELP